MKVCCCALAGTDACKNCNVVDISEINSINNRYTANNDYKINNSGTGIFKEVPIKDTYDELAEVKKDLEDCKKDLCGHCRKQKIFDSRWCDECRWG